MTNDSVGRVLEVDTAQVLVELTQELKGMTKATAEGVLEVARINSYLIIPVGSRRLVAIVTRVRISEADEFSRSGSSISLPTSRRHVYATLVGTIDDDDYRDGVTVFPTLDSAVEVASRRDLDIIFETPTTAETMASPGQPGYCIPIGTSPLFDNLPIAMNPDVAFGKHLAVLGSTGSGKSSTVASLIQSVLAHEAVKHTHFVILDTNGEYRAAFESPGGSIREDCLYLPTEPLSTDRLVIPYWFLNSDDFVRMFRASPGIQRPVLLESLRLARNAEREQSSRELLAEELVREINRIWALASRTEKTSKDVRSLADGLIARLQDDVFQQGWLALQQVDPTLNQTNVITRIQNVRGKANEYIEQNTYPGFIPADARAYIDGELSPIYSSLTGARPGVQVLSSAATVDSPSFFPKVPFRTRYLEEVLRRDDSAGSRARDNAAPMLLRIDRLLQDARYSFLLGAPGEQLPDAVHVLAAFLRDAIGLGSATHYDPALATHDEVEVGLLPFYDRQRGGAHGHNVVIIDLSLLAAEVLESVTAIVGRLILEFLERLGESIDTRGRLPVVIVLEEAQNYIRHRSEGVEESVARDVFERIAREGRKYGLGLVIASQRPSEVSKTVLSQCSTFIVHRLQSPEDLRYFKEIVPATYASLLEQLPALAPQTAIVLGEGVRAPALVRIRTARPAPMSRDPRFFEHWSTSEVAIDVEDIARTWERRSHHEEDAVDEEEEASPEQDDRWDLPDPNDESDDIPF